MNSWWAGSNKMPVICLVAPTGKHSWQ